MNWKRAIERLSIDESVVHDNIGVGRISQFRYVVLKDGEVRVFGGSNHPTMGYLVSQMLTYITGIPQPVPCADCDQPRESLSYCRRHYNERHAEYNRRMRHG